MNQSAKFPAKSIIAGNDFFIIAQSSKINLKRRHEVAGAESAAAALIGTSSCGDYRRCEPRAALAERFSGSGGGVVAGPPYSGAAV